MEDNNLWVIWHSELKMWLRTGYKFRQYAHTTQEMKDWIKNYEEDGDKNPEWLIIYNIDNIIKNMKPLSEQEEADA